MNKIDQIINRLTRNIKPKENEIKLINKNPKAIYHYSLFMKKPYEKGEKVLAKNVQYSYYYLDFFYNDIKKNSSRLQLFEKAISNDAEHSYEYAIFNKKGRFELGEKTISESSSFSFVYARDIIKGKWELGENTISKDGYYSLEYSSEVIKDMFPKGENAIKNDDFWEEYQECIARNYLELAKKNKQRIPDKKIEKIVCVHFEQSYKTVIKNIIINDINNNQLLEKYGDLEFFDELIISISKNNIFPLEISNYMIARGLVDNKTSKEYIKNKQHFSNKIKNFLKQHSGKTVDELICSL
jgi:hypothetical protein